MGKVLAILCNSADPFVLLLFALQNNQDRCKNRSHHWENLGGNIVLLISLFCFAVIFFSLLFKMLRNVV